MKITPDDPKLTAYALDELDPAERAEVEAFLKTSDEARREVEDIRRMSQLLTHELRGEACPMLSAEQKQVIENKLEETSSNVIQFPWRRVFALAGLAAAACVMVGLVVPAYQKSYQRRMSSVVLNEARQLDAAKDQYALDNNKTGDVVPDFEDLTPYLKAGSRLANSGGKDSLGNEFVLGDIQSRLEINAKTQRELALNSPSESGTFWGPYAGGPTDKKEGWENGWRNSHYSERSTSSINAPSATPKPEPASPTGGGTFWDPGDVNDRVTAGSGVRTKPAKRAVSAGVVMQSSPSSTDEKKSGWNSSPHNTLDGGSVFYSGGQAAFKKTFDRGADGVNGVIKTPSQMDDLGTWKSDNGGYPPISEPNSGPGDESYEHVRENPFLSAAKNPLSTFSADVDTASYANIRRFINEGSLPPRDAVRIEEMINYFPYDYSPPRNGDPFAVHVEVSACPWNGDHRLARIGIKGKEVAPSKRPPTNIVFLIDVSGSMAPENRLPLIRKGLRMMVKELNEDDRVAIVTYAGTSGLRLPSTAAGDQKKILNALDSLEAGGGTNGGAGIQLAYETATRNFIEGGVNRVILATDGDFNVGVTNQDELVRMIQNKAKSGVFLSVLGVGMGNLKDSTMEKLADKGNGHYAYLDTLDEARKVLLEQLNGTLMTIAKDVKIQVEFNPAQVGGYRLVGYEKRMLRQQDFNNDRKDAGEIGAGHTVTALYEIVPAGVVAERPEVDDLKYQKSKKSSPAWYSGWFANKEEMMTVKLRYKRPDGDTSKLMEIAVSDKGSAIASATDDFKFAAAVACFGMGLRDSPNKGSASWHTVLELAADAEGYDPNGYRAEFIELVKKARTLARE